MMIRKNMFIADRYEIIDKVGSGGMSDVYKALDHKLNRYVAVKVLKDEFSEDKGFVSKFKVEAQSAAGLAHPNIVNVFDVGDENGIYFIVMELVEGITLKKYIEKKGKLPVKEAVSIAIQIAQGIEAAHNNHIIHRDIKPQNVIISREGKVKVTDFGIARAASANTINSNAMGSVHYISPEQARGGYIDDKSDIYSLGISLYEMLTGKVPFEGDSTVTIALQHINEELPSPKLEVPDLPISVEKIIEKCTQKKSERRYLKVSELIADLKKSLITPNEDFVVLTPLAINNGATIMMTEEEVNNIRKGVNSAALNNVNTSRDYDELDEEDFDDDMDDELDEMGDDIDSANPKFDKVVTIVAIITSVVALIAFVLVIINVSKGCNSGNNDPYKDKATETSTGISDKQTRVPNVLGMTESEAKSVLSDKKLGMSYDYGYSTQYAAGTVMKQSHNEGTIVDKHTTIVVTISRGAETVYIPSVEGKTREEATNMLTGEDYEFKVEVDYEVNNEIEAEGCIRIEIEEKKGQRKEIEVGKPIEKGSTVYLIISSGVDDSLITVPELEGKDFETMKTELETLGFVVKNTDVYSDTIPEGQIISASYQMGTKLPKGTDIEISVSLGKEPVKEEPTPEQPKVEKVDKTQVFMKGFSILEANLPTIDIEGEDGTVTTEVVKVGTLEFDIYVNGSKEVKYPAIIESVEFNGEEGYSQNNTSFIVDETENNMSVRFEVTLVYDDNGTEKRKVVYYEDNCITTSVEVEVPVED